MICYVVNLSGVQRPSRYINRETNSVHKQGAVRVALAFPDIYDVGMSHLGLRILYDIANSLPYASCERVFHPWLDLEEAMRREGSPLRSLESATPVREFDVLGFSLQYELAYTSVLNMLSLGGIPLRSEGREEKDPIIIAGGPCTVNPLPMSPFVDAFLVGDGEEALVEMLDIVHAHKASGSGRREAILNALAGMAGVYVPSVHGTGGHAIKRRYIKSLEDAPYPLAPVVPFTQIVHDRVNIEVARGCTMGCRFCQAGMIYRPLRERSPERALKIAEESIRRTGYEEVSFSSLSAGDYSGLLELVRGFNRRFADMKVSISLPSLRVKSVNEELLKEIVSVRKTGFTIAPEAATERLRSAINKDFREEDYERSLETLFKAGWLNLKLYYMVGLPTERDEDIEAIPAMVMKALKTAKRHTGRYVNISVSVSPFVPKAHTPFQWSGQEDMAEIRRKKDYLRRNLKKINFKDHAEETSMLEAAFARGDARLSALIEAAFKEGARLDGWSEAFDFAIWQRAMERTGLDAADYARRAFALEEPLPWDFVDIGVSKGFLKRENERATGSEFTEDCRATCSSCGLKCEPEEKKEPAAASALSRLRQARAMPERRPIRVRAVFSKAGLVRYLSHRELMTHITRGLRRAGVMLEHTKGFHPTPKLALGPPLGVGVAGLNEYFDMEMLPHAPLETLREKLNAELAEGIEVKGLVPLRPGEASLQGFVSEYLYEVEGPGAGDIDGFLALNEYPVEREKRTVDVRRMVVRAEALSGTRTRLHLRDMGDDKVRLEEVAREVFKVELQELDITRVAMYGQGGAEVPPFGEAMRWQAAS